MTSPIKASKNIPHTKALEILVRKHFDKYLNQEGITDICYNGGNSIFYMDQMGKWHEEPTGLNFEDAMALATTAAVARQKSISASQPIMSADLPGGERIQFNIPPSVDRGKCVIAIRIPSKKEYTIEDYEKQGMFEFISTSKPKTSKTDQELIDLYKKKEFSSFLQKAVEYKKTIIFAGKTGSGKTTFVKSLIKYIPNDERLISIEDTKEIVFTHHKNSVNLYYPDNSKHDDELNASKLLKSCLRLLPSRVLLTEIRDAAAYDFIDAVKNGHYGSITSMHAGSVRQAFSRLMGMYRTHENAKGMPFEMIREDLLDLVDIIVCMTQDVQTGKRYLNDIYFKEVDQNLFKEKL